VRTRLAGLGLLAALAAPAAHGADALPRLVVLGRIGKVPSQIVLRNVGATSSVRVLVPAGYALTLGQAAGTAVGSGSADQATDAGTRTIGGVVSVAPDGTAVCDGAAHAAVWSLALVEAKAVVATVVVAADSAPASLLVCTGGTGVTRLTLQLGAAALAPPTQPARPVWEALLSYPDGSQAASVATLAIPAKLSLKASFQRFKHAIALSGRLLEAGAAGPGGRRVVVSIGTQPSTLTSLGATRTKPDATWRGVITNVKRTLYVQAQAISPELDTTGSACTPPTLTAPCVSATVAGYTAVSAIVKVVVARR
jgi:hypothetical protein